MRHEATLTLALLLFGFSGNALAQDQRLNRYEIEGGVLFTQNMEIHGYQQPNATAGWNSYDPTVRFEYWSVRNEGWNFGVVVQPIYTRYADPLTADLNYNGSVYHAGDPGTLDYQFHTLRFTANHRVVSSTSRESYLRLGVSGVARYADLKFKTPTASFHRTDFLVLPLANAEWNAALNAKHSVFGRADFLPSPNGNVFLDGLFDVLFAVKTNLDGTKSVDAGVRLFFGGYDPNKPDDFANRVFFVAAVARYSW
jgi:hypothetical protein